MNDSHSIAPRACPGCRAAARRVIGEVSGWAVASCAFCATVYATDLPTAEDAAEDYDQYYGESNLVVPDFVGRQLEAVVETFAPFRQLNRMLDVGFGAGSFMQAARAANWQIEGSEVSRPAIEQMRGQGFTVHHADLPAAQLPPESFDVIVAVEVVEHVADPGVQVREMACLLRPGGLLWMTTPNGAGLSERLLQTRWSVVAPPEHLQLFSPRGMNSMLRRAGFGTIQIKTHGLNPFEILHALRGKTDVQAIIETETPPEKTFDRVQTSYALNESLTSSPLRRAVKSALNETLSALRLGDSLKVRAIK